MVKIDYTRDYYGDLEASPEDSIDVIKKKYRKLGMLALIHPLQRFDLTVFALQHSNITPTETLMI